MAQLDDLELDDIRYYLDKYGTAKSIKDLKSALLLLQNMVTVREIRQT